MAVPSFLSGSMFYFWLVPIVLTSRSEQWFNFEKIFKILDYGVRPWFPNMGKVFLYTLVISKMGLVFNLFGKQKTDTYIDRLV